MGCCSPKAAAVKDARKTHPVSVVFVSLLFFFTQIFHHTVGRTRLDGHGNAYGSANVLLSGIQSMGFMQSSMSNLDIYDYAISAQDIQYLARADCVMGDWSSWSTCSTGGSLGSTPRVAGSKTTTAVQTRNRKVAQHPINGGTACSNEVQQEKRCDSEFEL